MLKMHVALDNLHNSSDCVNYRKEIHLTKLNAKNAWPTILSVPLAALFLCCFSENVSDYCANNQSNKILSFMIHNVIMINEIDHNTFTNIMVLFPKHKPNLHSETPGGNLRVSSFYGCTEDFAFFRARNKNNDT